MSISHRRGIASTLNNSISPHILGEQVENMDSEYYGLSCTNLTLSEVANLIEAIQRDETDEFESFYFDQIQNLRVNVVLSRLPVSYHSLFRLSQ